MSGSELAEWMAYFDLMDSVETRQREGLSAESAYRSVFLARRRA